MPGYVRDLVAFILGGVVTFGVYWTKFHQQPRMHRTENGMVLGGYVLPGSLGRLQVEAARYGIDSASYDIRVDDCPSLTFWDVSLSGIARGENVIEFLDGSDGLILQYQTSQRLDFLYSESAQYFTRVRVDNPRSMSCVENALSEIFEHARPAYSQSEKIE